MSGERERILARLRTAAPPSANPGTGEEGAATGPVPHWEGDRVSRFVDKAESAGATVARLAGADEVGGAVKRYLDQQGLTGTLILAPDPRLDALTLEEGTPALRRSLQPEDRTVLTVAYAAIAETGTLVLRSGADTPTGLNFLPENFLCLLEQTDIFDHPEAVWRRLQQEGPLPRCVNFITGPSRTADVEQTLQVGAHGPRRVHILTIQPRQ